MIPKMILGNAVTQNTSRNNHQNPSNVVPKKVRKGSSFWKIESQAICYIPVRLNNPYEKAGKGAEQNKFQEVV
jgi:hypothetical protein